MEGALVKVPPAPSVIACFIGYYAAFYIVGMLWPLTTHDPLQMGIGSILFGGGALIAITHCFFLIAPSILGDWFSYLMVGGVPAAIVLEVTRLAGWTRCFVVVGPLFAAHFYGFVVAGMHF